MEYRKLTAGFPRRPPLLQNFTILIFDVFVYLVFLNIYFVGSEFVLWNGKDYF